MIDRKCRKSSEQLWMRVQKLTGSSVTYSAYQPSRSEESVIAKPGKLAWVNMSLTLSCKLVEVFAVICAVFLQNQAQIALYFSIKSHIFSRPRRISSLWRTTIVQWQSVSGTEIGIYSIQCSYSYRVANTSLVSGDWARTLIHTSVSDVVFQLCAGFLQRGNSVWRISVEITWAAVRRRGDIGRRGRAYCRNIPTHSDGIYHARGLSLLIYIQLYFIS